jgi:hypothetical protein
MAVRESVVPDSFAGPDERNIALSRDHLAIAIAKPDRPVRRLPHLDEANA